MKTYLKKTNEGELPQSGKGNKLPGRPGREESPKEIGPEEEHTKAHDNYVYPRLKRRRES